MQQFSGYPVLVRPDADDAWLFAQINNGNAISLHLSEEYTWTRCENMERTIEKLFSEPFGQGYLKKRGRKETQRRLTRIIIVQSGYRYGKK